MTLSRKAADTHYLHQCNYACGVLPLILFKVTVHQIRQNYPSIKVYVVHPLLFHTSANMSSTHHFSLWCSQLQKENERKFYWGYDYSTIISIASESALRTLHTLSKVLPYTEQCTRTEKWDNTWWFLQQFSKKIDKHWKKNGSKKGRKRDLHYKDEFLLN